ncbi:MAG: GGDEF domain-containing protein [Proteobacteria bacterium]|nr:GGDEF domain-containing protein [Pseudomonadota bacterium]MBU1596551.1 GGDEF domain-containing protein [Pseudomonadota bacterium]
MHSTEHPEVMWGLGLDPDTAAFVEAAAGAGYALRNLPPDAVAWMRGSGGQTQAAWVPWQVWIGLPKNRRLACGQDECVRRILILEQDAEVLETEQVLAEGFVTAVRAPLTRFKVRDALLRLREMDSLAADLRRKTEEIALERELLVRKGNHLSFLNRVLSRATASLDPVTILSKARSDLRSLLPLTALAGAFWSRPEHGSGLDAELYMPCLLTPPESEEWQQALIAAAERQAGYKVSEYRQACLAPDRGRKLAPGPSAGRLLFLPLSVGGESFGFLALMTDKGLRLAKDQVQTLNACVNHLALALRNALLYRQVKLQADRDGLTKIGNRRSFEERLAAEAARHGRYDQPLSLILVDVDHFKAVNDTHGHQAGDDVLREMAALMGEGLRSSDYPARYGGEEFVVILPHTSREQAALLAERLRQRVAGRFFRAGAAKAGLSLTVSAGVAALSPGSSAQELVLLADQALYLAKNGGRNRVVVAGPLDIPQAGQAAGDAMEQPLRVVREIIEPRIALGRKADRAAV